MPTGIPLTPIAERYAKLPKSHGGRLDEAKKLLAHPDKLVEEFLVSVDQAERFFMNRDRSREPFYERPRPLGAHVQPGLASTTSLCRWFEESPRTHLGCARRHRGAFELSVLGP